MSERYLEGKVAWVTGSSRGIGRVVAEHLASLGAAVAIHGTSPTSTRAFGEADSLQAVADAIAADQDAKIVVVYGDLSDAKVVAACADQVVNALGPIDILVNCAGGDIGAQGTMGVNSGTPVGNDAVNISLEDIKVVLDRNLMTCIYCCRQIAPSMMARKTGWIINVGSTAGAAGGEHLAIYGAAKSGVHEYTRCLAALLRPYDVHVNCVVPGSVLSPRFIASRPVNEERMVKQGTLDRYGWSIEVAEAVAFLASAKSSYITGQLLRVDGGGQLFAL